MVSYIPQFSLWLPNLLFGAKQEKFIALFRGKAP